MILCIKLTFLPYLLFFVLFFQLHPTASTSGTGVTPSTSVSLTPQQQSPAPPLLVQPEQITIKEEIPPVISEASNASLELSSNANPPSPAPSPSVDNMHDNYNVNASMRSSGADYYWTRKTEMEEMEHVARMELLKKEMRMRDLDIERKEIELEIKYTELLLLQKKLKEWMFSFATDVGLHC